MEYKHTQNGYLLAGSMVGMAVILAGISAKFSWNPLNAFVVVVLVVTAVLFYSMTVLVTGSDLIVRFGPGIIRKKIPLSQVRDVRAVRNPWYYGWGIHLTPHGWLYNVSGLIAVEVDLASGRRFRIGTDDPQGLVQALKERARG